jgi:DNA-binding transcriptional LysR family regulator
MNRIEQSELVFSELNGFAAVAAHRSFRRAANELSVAPSTLSHAVASLEARLGVKLFHRTTRSVSLSEAGERFLERIRPALEQLTGAMETANDFRATPRGTLRINSAPLAVARLLDSLVVPYLVRYPDMRIEIVTEGRFVDIVADGFDAGIRLAESVPRDMVSIPCGPPMRYVVVGSPAYLAKHGRPGKPSDLLAYTCVRSRMPSGAALPWWFQKKGRTLEINVDGPLTLDSSELMVRAALGGIGLAWVGEWVAEPHVERKKLVKVLEDWSPTFPGLCLYYPPHRHLSAGLRAFVAMIRELRLAK